MSNGIFRTCPESGLQFHKPAEWLMRTHAVFAVVILLFGGITALLVTLTRWPAVHLLPPDRFYQMLTAHGVNMLIFWIITFEIAVLYFCSSTLLRCRLATPRIAWLGFALMLIGVVVNNLAVANGWVCTHADRRGCQQSCRCQWRCIRHDDVIRADAGQSQFLPGPHNICGWCTAGLFCFSRHSSFTARTLISRRIGTSGSSN